LPITDKQLRYCRGIACLFDTTAEETNGNADTAEYNMTCGRIISDRTALDIVAWLAFAADSDLASDVDEDVLFRSECHYNMHLQHAFHTPPELPTNNPVINCTDVETMANIEQYQTIIDLLDIVQLRCNLCLQIGHVLRGKSNAAIAAVLLA